MKLFKSMAFTLAEVLITLSIIGVVAAMAFPTLKGAYEKRRAETSLQNNYNKIKFAVEKSIADGAVFKGYDGSSSGISKKWYDKFLSTLQPSKFCNSTTGCWTYSAGISSSSGVSFVLQDGSSFIIVPVSKGTISSSYGVNTDKSNVVIYMDVNGGDIMPNTVGQDIFILVWNGSKLVPAGNNSTNAQLNASCSKNGNGNLCMQKIILNGWSIPKDIWDK